MKKVCGKSKSVHLLPNSVILPAHNEKEKRTYLLSLSYLIDFDLSSEKVEKVEKIFFLTWRIFHLKIGIKEGGEVHEMDVSSCHPLLHLWLVTTVLSKT